MKPVKYLIIPNDDGTESPIIFDGKLKHKDVADKLGIKPVSAGFIIIPHGHMFCGEGSESLNVESRPHDKELIQKFLGMTDAGK